MQQLKIEGRGNNDCLYPQFRWHIGLSKLFVQAINPGSIGRDRVFMQTCITVAAATGQIVKPITLRICYEKIDRT